MVDTDTQVLSAEFVSEVIEHMNVDHADSLKDYAIAFGSVDWADEVRMTALSTAGIELQCYSNSGRTETVMIGFEKVLKRPEQVRGALVALARRARIALGKESGE